MKTIKVSSIVKVLAVVVMTATMLAVNADILVQDSFEGFPTPQDALVADVVADHLTASDFNLGNLGSGVIFPPAMGGAPAPGDSSGLPYYHQPLSAYPTDNSSVVRSFWIEPDMNCSMDITGFEFYAAATRDNNFVQLSYQIGDGAVVDVGFSDDFEYALPAQNTTMTLHTFQIALFDVSERVTFFMDMINEATLGNEMILLALDTPPYNGGGPASQQFYNDITVRGTSIPEPSTLILLGLSGLLLIKRRRF